MKILYTTSVKPIPIFLDRYLSIDDVSYRFVGDQGLFSATADVPSFALHFLAQNVHVPSVVLEWPTLEDLALELESDDYDYVGITFKIIDLYKLGPMIERIRQVSPKTQIILGGYGTLGLNEPGFADLQSQVDHICWTGDGVQFIRKLVGGNLNAPVTCHLPVETIRIPWMNFQNDVGYILSALGCAWQCEFCCTSAYAQGQVIEVMSPEEIVESMQWYYAQHRNMSDIYVMDEELLMRKDKVNAIGRLIREDSEFGLKSISYLAFSTVKSLAEWEPEELLLNGVGIVWTGLESKYSYQRKKGGSDQKQLMKALQQHGIQGQISWMIGDDCQTKENIHDDVADLIDHEPCTVQLTSLSAFPGTALYERLKREGRGGQFNPEEYHLFGETMQPLHFTHEELLDTISQTYRRIYESQGPLATRVLNVHMNGYEYCMGSDNPHLRGPKLEFFKRRIRNTIPIIKVATELAPTTVVKNRMLDLNQRYQELFGPLRRTQQFLADRLMSLAEEELERRTRDGYTTLREVALKRYTYQDV